MHTTHRNIHHLLGADGPDLDILRVARNTVGLGRPGNRNPCCHAAAAADGGAVADDGRSHHHSGPAAEDLTL